MADWQECVEAFKAEKFIGLQGITIFPDPGISGLYTINRKLELLNFLQDVDVVFPVLHGTFGEDGTLQGLLEMADLAYVGGGVLGSSAVMDKAMFADVMQANKIPFVPTQLILRSAMDRDMKSALKLAESIGNYPLFVKPANLGSSVGISKVNCRSDLMEGLMEAAQYDRRIIVQPGLTVREIEVAVMGNDQPMASVCGEVLPGEEFYSYEAKYHDAASKTVIPAHITREQSDRIRALAIRAYQSVDMAGLSRVDFFIDKRTNEVYINEINAIPGFTRISMFPMLWEASGVPNRDLIDKLVEFAFERKEQRDRTKRVFRRDE